MIIILYESKNILKNYDFIIKFSTIIMKYQLKFEMIILIIWNIKNLNTFEPHKIKIRNKIYFILNWNDFQSFSNTVELQRKILKVHYNNKYFRIILI